MARGRKGSQKKDRLARQLLTSSLGLGLIGKWCGPHTSVSPHGRPTEWTVIDQLPGSERVSSSMLSTHGEGSTVGSRARGDPQQKNSGTYGWKGQGKGADRPSVNQEATESLALKPRGSGWACLLCHSLAVNDLDYCAHIFHLD